VLVFPKLCDRFGMVVIEGFSQGLPGITASQAGAGDLVRSDNGLIVPAADAHAIADALDWCTTYRSELKGMRRKALHTAPRLQWFDFRGEATTNDVSGVRDVGCTT
jgi:glycosyltransferase involved in cell wall biosynthesis